MIILLYIYILSIVGVFITCFWKIIFPVWNHLWILLLNDSELRGGGWLITQTLEIWTFLWVPYRIRKHPFDSIHQYSEKSFYPFNEFITEDLMFRDTNYSFFSNDNFKRANYFFKKNFPLKSVPKIWLSIPFSFSIIHKHNQ